MEARSSSHGCHTRYSKTVLPNVLIVRLLRHVNQELRHKPFSDMPIHYQGRALTPNSFV
jgi:hypothetical protein